MLFSILSARVVSSDDDLSGHSIVRFGWSPNADHRSFDSACLAMMWVWERYGDYALYIGIQVRRRWRMRLQRKLGLDT